MLDSYLIRLQRNFSNSYLDKNYDDVRKSLVMSTTIKLKEQTSCVYLYEWRGIQYRKISIVMMTIKLTYRFNFWNPPKTLKLLFFMDGQLNKILLEKT